MTKEELTKLITKLVIENMKKQDQRIHLGVSNRHVHLDRADMNILFGINSELTNKKDLGQPGQFAAEEVVTMLGPKGEIERVRILGPLRSKTQIEISASDGRKLGINAPLRESGLTENTPGVELIGPAGKVHKDMGVIVSLRHIHMTPKDALSAGVKDGQRVSVQVGDKTKRGAILQNVLIRISDRYALEMHIDVDEALALGVGNGDYAEIVE
ncbi:MAG: phosphate propanoyltransferase [Peptostreptococcaceae bacterium]|nr:phosphate propanoyltransferase [Peptostreptococcaceae bacterium]